MEYVADELGVPVLQLPALQRELSARADTTAAVALRAIIRGRRPGRAAHAHGEGGSHRDGLPPWQPVERGRARSSTPTTATSSAATSRRALRAGLPRDRAAAGARDRHASIAVSDEVRDDLVALGVARAERVRRRSLRLRPPATGARRRRGPQRDPRRARARRTIRSRRLGRPADRDQASARPRPHAARAARRRRRCCSRARRRRRGPGRRSEALGAGARRRRPLPVRRLPAARSARGTQPSTRSLLTSDERGDARRRDRGAGGRSARSSRPTRAARRRWSATARAGYLAPIGDTAAPGASGSSSSRTTPSCALDSSAGTAPPTSATGSRRGAWRTSSTRSTEGCCSVRVLHVHKLTGVSGSESHLLALLPALRAAGVDARFLGLDVAGERCAALLRAARRAGRPLHGASAAASTSAREWRAT